MHLKMSSAKWRPFCLGLNVLNMGWHNSNSVISGTRCIGSKRAVISLIMHWSYITFALINPSDISVEAHRLIVFEQNTNRYCIHDNHWKLISRNTCINHLMCTWFVISLSYWQCVTLRKTFFEIIKKSRILPVLSHGMKIPCSEACLGYW